MGDDLEAPTCVECPHCGDEIVMGDLPCHPSQAKPDPFLLFILVSFLLAALWGLAGCARPQHPYVTLQIPPHDELAWFSDGPDMMCWAHNPTSQPFYGSLKCEGDIYLPMLPVYLAPHEDRPLGFCQVLNKDVHAEPCHLVPAFTASVQP